MKINVVGTSGSGKSTLSKKIATTLDIPFLEMDAIFWKPNWTEPTNEEFFPKLEKALAQESWVLDGNYSRTRSIKWKDVDMVIWVDFSFTRTLLQAMKRALHRSFTKVELWKGTGNRESFRKLFSKHSIVLWTIKQYTPTREKYLALMESEEYQHIEFIRVQSPRKMRTLVQSLQARVAQIPV